MTQSTFNQRKKRSAVFKKLALSFILLIGLIVAGTISISKRIGDSYYKAGKWGESLFWYQVNYEIFRSNESLKELCFTALLVNNTKITIEYTPILLEKNILQEDDLLGLTIQYIEALYDNGDTEEFRTVYRESINDFVGNIDTTQPLSYISLDNSASNDTLLFAIEIGDYILEVNNQKNIFKLPIYYSQSLIYQKLGNTEMHDKLIEQYEQVKQELQDGIN